jgi:hypothetical protein
MGFSDMAGAKKKGRAIGGWLVFQDESGVSQRPPFWLRVEWLPGYAPDLNPVESLWGSIKGEELANQSADDLSEVADALRAGFDRVFGQRQLLLGFLNHCGLFLTNLSLYYAKYSDTYRRPSRVNRHNVL